MAVVMMKCPLCSGEESALFHQDQRRPYYRCEACLLVFVPAEYCLSEEEERARYDLHENDPNDEGYRNFLSKLLIPMTDVLKSGAEGLDFGCGPGPLLSMMFQEVGFSCTTYDPFYNDDKPVLEQRYDFVSCSEVLEHCHHPKQEFERLISLTKEGGVIGVMTQLVRDQAAFKTWRYIDDDTHVCFFSRETMEWLGDRHGLRVLFCENSVTLFFV